jgi:large subunit ribosomal protein L15
MNDPLKFFKSGKPIPKNGTPPINAIGYYTAPENRGYLADPDLIRQERFKLAQKYGYELKTITDQLLRDMLHMRKDPRQIWFGLEPGWVVNLKEKVVLKSVDKKWIEYYKS